MKKLKRFSFSRYLIIAAAIFSAAAQISSPRMLAQTNKTVEPTKIMYSTSSSTNDLGALTTVNPGDVKMSAQKQELLNQLDIARTSNNTAQKEMIEKKLHELNGTSPVKLVEASNTTGGFAGNIPVDGGLDFNTSTVGTGGFFASATQTNTATMSNPGTIWAAATQFNGSGTDTCKIYFSTNGGQSWVYAYLFYFGINMDFRAGELDIELAYDGSVLWIYGVAGYTDLTNNRANSILFRFNTTANTYNGYTLQWPGYATTTNLYYNPRLTSDNANYTSGTYIYLTSSFDSTGSTHINRQKFAHIENPFVASPTINYAQPNANGGFFWNTSGVPVGSYLWTDIAYYKTAGNVNRLITVYNVPGSGNYNLYLAWSDDYGTTVAGNSSIAETAPDYGARMVFNGVTGNQNGMIAYIRQFSGNDWDPYYRATVDGGTVWTGGFIDGSGNRARSVDVIAPRGLTTAFKTAYTQDSTAGTFGYYTGGVPGVWNAPFRTTVTTAGVDTIFTKTIAGYKLGGGDDCLAIYSMGTGTNVSASRLCQGTVGISGNTYEIPSEYTLQQNYPNPFNPVTSIKFSIPASSFVNLVVYNAAGEVVNELVNGQLGAGSYNYTFNALNLASGVYFYKLTAGDFTSVKKMLLVK